MNNVSALDNVVVDLEERSGAEQTRESLILAGERLFAERGIDGVSLREVNQAAGQRNRSAAHYHFGTRLGLIEAIYDYRAGHLNQRRLSRLAELLDKDALPDIRELVLCFIRPLIDEVEETEGGSYFLRFLANVNMHHDMNICQMWRNRHVEATERLFSLMHQVLPQLPVSVFSVRFGLMMVHLMYVMAERERFLNANQNATMSSDVFYANLIDTVTAMMSAPVSAETSALL